MLKDHSGLLSSKTLNGIVYCFIVRVPRTMKIGLTGCDLYIVGNVINQFHTDPVTLDIYFFYQFREFAVQFALPALSPSVSHCPYCQDHLV